MASETGFITDKPPYSNNDLNTIFAPILQIDYGLMGTTYQSNAPTTLIREGIWSHFNSITQNNTATGNITVMSGSSNNSNGFRINNPGMYKLNIILFFAGGNGTNNETGANVNFF